MRKLFIGSIDSADTFSLEEIEDEGDGYMVELNWDDQTGKGGVRLNQSDVLLMIAFLTTQLVRDSD